ncbi:MAG TPA: hypothetical protein EYG38_04625, partial [Verrucomicrobia bacterium]|nr:hypothetical protein [Verrucomicrobiota bacterium]
KIIAIHGRENLDTSEVGRMVAIKIGAEPKPGEKGPVVLDESYEIWRQPLSMFTSSAVLVGDRVYQMTHTGDLQCLNADTGEIIFKNKLGNGQLHASPMYADGKLYIPMANGKFFILKVNSAGVEILDEEQLEGGCLGAPILYNGKILVHTLKKLYCFGNKGDSQSAPKWVKSVGYPKAGKGARLQIIPTDVLLSPGENVDFRIRVLDENGFVVEEIPSSQVQWQSFIPPTAKVKTRMNARFNSKGQLVADSDPIPSAGAFKGVYKGMIGFTRGRILPALPYKQGFESYELAAKLPEGHIEAGAQFGYPPLPWIGARFKWEVRNKEGSKTLRKTLDRVLFQRAITFIGDPNLSDYTVQVDVMTEGNRRIKGNIGVINQRYFITLIGNAQQIEVYSNHDRIKVNKPFSWKQNRWYTIKSRVDVAGDGSGVIRAKVWPREEPEPGLWTIEVPHEIAHRKGAPGLIGFSPQSLYPVYIDNIRITEN